MKAGTFQSQILSILVSFQELQISKSFENFEAP